MTTYATSGVSLSRGDEATSIAYAAAKRTFDSRKGRRGTPLRDLDESFTGALDMGDFYLTQNEDGVGSKVRVADAIGKYDTLGYDLLAMVADDAVCAGAEVISVTNTLDMEHVDPKKVAALMSGLAKACREQKIVIPGGEIAELPDQVRGFLWNATAVGIVEKKKLLTGAKVRPGDVLLGLLENGFRSNGFTLVRRILETSYGSMWPQKPFGNGKSWGDMVLTPSTIYHGCVLGMIGRFREKPRVQVHGIAHITGGGIPGNLPRILEKNGLGAALTELPELPTVIRRVQEIGKIADREAGKVWNMGVGMILALPEREVEKAVAIAKKHGIHTQILGKVVQK